MTNSDPQTASHESPVAFLFDENFIRERQERNRRNSIAEKYYPGINDDREICKRYLHWVKRELFALRMKAHCDDEDKELLEFYHWEQRAMERLLESGESEFPVLHDASDYSLYLTDIQFEEMTPEEREKLEKETNELIAEFEARKSK